MPTKVRKSRTEVAALVASLIKKEYIKVEECHKSGTLTINLHGPKNKLKLSEWKETNIRIDWDTKTGKIKFGEPFGILSCLVTKQDDFKNPTDEVEHMIICTAFSSLGNKLMLQFNFNAKQEVCYLTIMDYDKPKTRTAIKFAIKYEDIFSTN
jgi:hypothetical protein